VTAPFNGDLFRNGSAFVGSALGFAGALAFLTATGGRFSGRALADDSGRALCDGTLLGGRLTEGARLIVRDVSEVLEAKLRRRED
jgi:hypothetical protein